MGRDETLGAFEEQVLLAVLHAGEDAFGMNVRRELEARSGRSVSIGAVYATLDRLEAKSLVTSTRSRGGDASRRIFQLTNDGTRALVETRAQRDRLWSGIELGGRVPRRA